MMDTAFALLINVIYGFLFFLGFGVMVLTTGFFGLAFWDKVARPLLQRGQPRE